MQNTYRILKAAPILSYLPRFIKLVRADVERSANMQKHPLINYPCPISSFILIPLVLSSPATVTEHRVLSTHDLFSKTLFRTPGTYNCEDSSKSQHRFFAR